MPVGQLLEEGNLLRGTEETKERGCRRNVQTISVPGPSRGRNRNPGVSFDCEGTALRAGVLDGTVYPRRFEHFWKRARGNVGASHDRAKYGKDREKNIKTQKA